MFKKHLTPGADAPQRDERSQRGKRRRRTALGALVVVGAWSAGAVGVGYAGWVTSGVGLTGAVNSGTMKPLVVTAATTGTGLFPGLSQSASYTVNNPNSIPVRISQVTVQSVSVTGGKVPANCATATVAQVTAAAGAGAVGTVLAAGATSSALPVTFTMDATSPADCEGVVSSATVKVDGTSN